jgi:hypothetical protein
MHVKPNAYQIRPMQTHLCGPVGRGAGGSGLEHAAAAVGGLPTLLPTLHAGQQLLLRLGRLLRLWLGWLQLRCRRRRSLGWRQLQGRGKHGGRGRRGGEASPHRPDPHRNNRHRSPG